MSKVQIIVGTGWRPLCEELAEALKGLDPPGELLAASVDASGLPSFRVRLDPRVKAQGRRLVHEYESRAVEICEGCGGGARVRAGAVVTALCDDCA